MNGRRLYREYAQAKGKEAKSFVSLTEEGYGYGGELITLDNKGVRETVYIDHKDMVNWIIRTKKFKEN